jgi:cation transport regulator
MPYTSPPDKIKGLPVHAQDIWISAFNSAWKEYNGDEAKCNATAWAAIEKAGYKKNADGNWIKEEINLKEYVKEENGKWFVYSESGKELGGPYDSEEEANKRLKQIEYFKHKEEMKKEPAKEIKEEIKRDNDSILTAMKLKEESPLKAATKIKERVYRVELMNLEPPNVPIRGWSANNRYYSDRSLNSLAKLLENRRSMATGHHDDGGLRELGGITRNVIKVDGKKILEADYKILHENPDWFATVLEEQIANPSANLVALSINAKGKGYTGEVNGKKGEIVEDAIRAKGCDAVFDAAAGGKFKTLLEEKRSKRIMDLTLDELKEENPEIVEKILKEEKEKTKVVEDKLKLSEEELAKYKKAEAEFKEKEIISKLLKESKLTDEQALGLAEEMLGKTDEQKKKLIEGRIELLKKVAAPQKITNISEKDPDGGLKPLTETEKTVIKQIGISEEMFRKGRGEILPEKKEK